MAGLFPAIHVLPLIQLWEIALLLAGQRDAVKEYIQNASVAHQKSSKIISMRGTAFDQSR
jgi:hypothetical protein